MMDKDIFDYREYREYLSDWIIGHPKRGRGLRSALASAINAPVSHVSQVLSKISHLSMEQAEDVNDYLGHTIEQSEFFLLLVQLSRAGTPKLQSRIESQIQKVREKRLILKDRLNIKNSISREDQAVFYSTWQYAAAHILLTIDKYRNKEAIAQYLGISLKKSTELLEFLTSIGLAKPSGNGYAVGPARIHLGNDSPMISKHHINWRMKAIQSLEREDASDSLHYSSCVSISKEDALRIKSLLVKAIENAKAIIRDSKEEEIHSFCMDFFKL